MDTRTFNYQLNGAVVYNIRMIDNSIPNTDKYARLAVEVASDKLASDILLLLHSIYLVIEYNKLY